MRENSDVAVCGAALGSVQYVPHAVAVLAQQVVQVAEEGLVGPAVREENVVLARRQLRMRRAQRRVALGCRQALVAGTVPALPNHFLGRLDWADTWRDGEKR